MSGIDIAEFLLARIAEDRELVTAVREYRRKREPLEGDATGGYEWDNSGLVYVSPARVLAECEAKRRIVELAHKQFDKVPVDGVAELVFDEVLVLLALPHADHPDYDPAWRP
jgi:hypothetical protein